MGCLRQLKMVARNAYNQLIIRRHYYLGVYMAHYVLRMKAEMHACHLILVGYGAYVCANASEDDQR